MRTIFFANSLAHGYIYHKIPLLFAKKAERACLCRILHVDVKDMLQEFYDNLDKA